MNFVLCPSKGVEIARSQSHFAPNKRQVDPDRDVEILVTLTDNKRYRCQIAEAWDSSIKYPEGRNRREVTGSGQTWEEAVKAARANGRAAGLSEAGMQLAMDRLDKGLQVGDEWRRELECVVGRRRRLSTLRVSLLLGFVACVMILLVVMELRANPPSVRPTQDHSPVNSSAAEPQATHTKHVPIGTKGIHDEDRTKTILLGYTVLGGTDVYCLHRRSARQHAA